MRGDGFEWMQDIYHGFYGYNGAPTDGSAWEGVTSEGGVGSKRVLRGGRSCFIYNDNDSHCRSASREGEAQGIRARELGFRLVMEITTNVSLPTNITPSVPSIPIITPSSNQEIFTNSIGIEFVQIPAGEFDMGSPSIEKYRRENEEPIHHVKIGKAFYIGKYEVTQKQFREVMGDNPSKFKGDDHPVESVSWYYIEEYIKKLNEKESTSKYRLPSEAEWEYAARAGTTTKYSFGDNESELGDYAWYGMQGKTPTTYPVGRKKPNPWGLYDMHGNVMELVQDKYHSTYIGAPIDGSAWGSGNLQEGVVRGGAWNNYAGNCRSAVRDHSGGNGTGLGFRLVRDL